MSVLIHNKKVGFNYEIIERYEAGIELFGPEVKSVRLGHGSLEGSYVIVRGGEAFIINMKISPYQVNNLTDYDELRTRKLLLTKDEIKALSELRSGLTIVPVSVYNKARKIKIEIAVVKGKKQFDKRENIKKRETDRDIRREYKR